MTSATELSDVEAMNALLRKTPTQSFCGLRAADTGEQLRVVMHVFPGAQEAQPVVVVADKNGKILTPLTGRKSAPKISIRTAVARVAEEYAMLSHAGKRSAGAQHALNQTIKVEVPSSSEDAFKRMDLREAWAACIFENGVMKCDPRYKSIESKRKAMTAEDFRAYFDELLDEPGAPYYSAVSNQSEDDGCLTVKMKKKLFEINWEPDTDDGTTPFDTKIPNFDEWRAEQTRPSKVVPIKVFHKGKQVGADDYDAIMSIANDVYFVCDIVLYWNQTNKNHTMMQQPREMHIGTTCASRRRSGQSGEEPVAIWKSVDTPTGSKREPEAEVEVDIASVISAGGKKSSKKKARHA